MQAVVYDVNVTDGSYIAIGYGHSMINTDMVYWGCNGQTWYQQDMHGFDHIKPYFEPYNEYNTTYYYNATSKVGHF